MTWKNLFSKGSWVRMLLLLGVLSGTSELRCYEGMFGVQHDSPHPIDRRFEGRLEFLGTNLEMSESIKEAREAWLREVERQSRRIEGELSPEGVARFREMQLIWKASLHADEAFFFRHFDGLRTAIGREGEILAWLSSSMRIRTRALILGDFVAIRDSLEETGSHID